MAAFVVTGGQDDVQAVAGQTMTFFGELGCQFPRFPSVAHGRGEDAPSLDLSYPGSAESSTRAGPPARSA